MGCASNCKQLRYLLCALQVKNSLVKEWYERAVFYDVTVDHTFYIETDPESFGGERCNFELG